MGRDFYPIARFEDSRPTYSLLPFRFFRMRSTEELLVNESGEFLFAPNGSVSSILNHELIENSDLYRSLKAKHFIADDSSAPLLDLLATKYRTKHSFIQGGTKLHIFVVTLRCDHTCLYCQVSRQTADREKFDMSEDSARRAIEIMMESPSPDITMELQGGEATLAFDRVTFIVDKAKQRALELNKNLRIVLTTNLAHLSNEMLEFIKIHDIHISTSLDGPAFIHNANRPRPGRNSHELAIRNLERCRAALGSDKISALMTTTHLSLDHATEIIDEYVRLNLHAVFLRPISPYGFALRTQRRTGYDMGAFLRFYKRGLERILDLNKSGYHLVEIYTRILLTKILTPDGTGYVDLQSPAGAGFNVLVYNYDGEIFLSDESRMLAEMGDRRFRIGSVHDNRRTLFRNEAFVSALEGAINQCVPGCSDCAFQTYCGADPIFHYATQGDVVGNKAFSSFCKRNMAVIEHLFELLRLNDAENMKVFWAWLTNRPYSEMREELPA